MLHSRFSELRLFEQEQIQGKGPGPDEVEMNMEPVEEETFCENQQKQSCFRVPNSSTSLRLNSTKKNFERLKHFKTPTPRLSPSKCSDMSDQNQIQIETNCGFECESWKRFGSNTEISPLVSSNIASIGANTSRGKPLLSEELSKLCSGSPMSAFNSDSDNSSCLFANDSFLSSADFTDDVFDDGTISLLHTKPSQSYTDYSDKNETCQHDISANFAKFENYERENRTAVSKGAAIAGSPSKIRHKNQRAVRRIKSISSFRFSPIKSSPSKAKTQKSGIRWYKAPTDTRLYEVRKREIREFSYAAIDAITLPRTRRALQFGECDNKSDPRDSLVEKAKAELHAELATIRTDTPESGYGSLNSSRQTPDLPQGDTPVARFSSRSPFPRAEYVPSPSSYNYKINNCAVPWLEKFDIISRLFRMAPLLVQRIFTYLEPKDLVLFSSVSRQWRMICSSHLPTERIRDQFIKTQEKAFQIRKENLGSSSKSGRHVTGPGTPLSSVQRLGSPAAASTPAKKTNLDKFLQLGKQLKEGEMLEKCKCGSPARIETKTRKASCSSSICQYEFCIKCKMGYHGNSPCMTTSSGSRKVRGPSVGSKKSKSSLRRSSRLSAND